MIKKFLMHKWPIMMFFAFIAGLLSACDNKDNPESPYVKDPEDNNKETAVLLYAVASNNLESNIYSDKNEILSCAASLDLNNCAFYLFEVTNQYEPKLTRLKKGSEGTYDFEEIKVYDTEVSSLDVGRMKDIFSDFRNDIKANRYGLILWSHGTGTDYYANPETRSSDNVVNTTLGEDGSFGYDKNPFTGEIIQMNIDMLAEAIPDNFFSFIWFDACYMNNIEVAYQLRDKADYMVGYPTEVFEWGMAYDLVLPYLIRISPDLVNGAKAFFDYYNENEYTALRVATVGVLDMSKIDRVADLCMEAYSGGGKVDKYNLQRYTRSSIGPFYDLNGYTRQMASQTGLGEDWANEWEEAMNDFVVFSAASQYDFNGYDIDKEQFCGVSCYIPNIDDKSQKEEYYRSLDWYKRTYPNNPE